MLKLTTAQLDAEISAIVSDLYDDDGELPSAQSVLDTLADRSNKERVTYNPADARRLATAKTRR